MRALLRKDWFLLTLIITLGVLLRFWSISHSSIWHDEGYTMFLVDRSPSEIIDATIRDVHPPLYYLTLHYWVGIFGHSEAAARGLSAVFGLGMIPLAYGIMRRLYRREVGLVAALFVCLAPFLVRYSQEARMYSQVAFFATLATYALVRGLSDRRWRWWGLYTLSLAAAIYSQYYGILVVGAHAIYLAIRLIWPEERRRPREVGQFGVAVLGAILLFLPWLPILLAQSGRVGAGYWIQKSWMTVHTIPSSIYQFFWYDHLDRFHLKGYLHEIPALIILGLSVWVILRRRERWREDLMIFSLFLVPMLFVFAYSRLRTPVYQDRYFPFAAVGFYLTLALWVFAATSRRIKLLIVGAVSALLLVGNAVVYEASSHQMRQAARLVASGYRPGDAIVSLDLFTFFDYSYYNQTGEPARVYYRGDLSYNEPGLLLGREERRVMDLGTVRPASGRIWAVGKPGRHPYYEAIPGDWRLIQTVDRGSVEIREYRRS